MVAKKPLGWYEHVKEEKVLAQGDLIRDLPVLEPTQPILQISQSVSVTTKLHNVVVLSQSCDLLNLGKISRVQVAPVWELKKFLRKNRYLNEVEKLNSLRENKIVRYYLMDINHSNLFTRGMLVVDLGEVYSIKLKHLNTFKNQNGNRITLKSPYKEQLSQHFARFYMRVGLPKDIPDFASNIKL